MDVAGPEASSCIQFHNFNCPAEVQHKLLKQANTLIANAENYLFTPVSPQAFMSFNLDDLTHNVTQNTTEKSLFCSNTLFEIDDPEGLLPTKLPQSASRKQSLQLPKHVALVPKKVTLDGKTPEGTDRYIIRFVAVKNPTFIPDYTPGFASAPLFQIQGTKVLETINAINTSQPQDLEQKIEALQLKMVNQTHLPIRNGFLDRILHYFSGKEDCKISQKRKDFFNNQVIPKLRDCHNALKLNDLDKLQNALENFPSPQEWAHFKSNAAIEAKKEMDTLRSLIEQKIALQRQLVPLQKCQSALEKQQASEVISLLQELPATNNLPAELTDKIQQSKQEITNNMSVLQRSLNIPPISTKQRAKIYYETRLADMGHRIHILENNKLEELKEIKNTFAYFNSLQKETKLLRDEQLKMHAGDDKIDFTAIEQLEKQLSPWHDKLYNLYLGAVTKEINILTQEQPKSLAAVKDMSFRFKERFADVEQLIQDKIKRHGTSSEPLDLSAFAPLKEQLQTIHQFLVHAMTNTLKTSLNQIELTTFEPQIQEAQQNLLLLVRLALTLDKSEITPQQQENIRKVTELLNEKQKAYPAMVQLQFKSEALIIRLRELCDAQQLHLAQTNSTKTKEITKNRWMFQGLTDLVGVTTDNRIQLKKQEKFVAKFKQDLNSDHHDIQQLIGLCAKKNPDELAEAFGLTVEVAEQVHALLTKLSKSTSFVAKITERSQQIDTVLSELSKVSIVTQLPQNDEDIQQNIINL